MPKRCLALHESEIVEQLMFGLADSVNDFGLRCFGMDDFCLAEETDAELFPGELERLFFQEDRSRVYRQSVNAGRGT